MIERWAPARGPAANDINEARLPRKNTDDLTEMALAFPDYSSEETLVPIGAILPTVVSDLLDHMADPSNYEVCAACHRPSWTFARWMAEDARKDERLKIEWEEFAAGEELSRRELLTRLEHTRAMLMPQPKVQYRPQLRVVKR